MSTTNKTIISWVTFVIGLMVFSIVFNTIGLVLGLQVKEEGGSIAPAIANIVALGFWLLSVLFLF